VERRSSLRHSCKLPAAVTLESDQAFTQAVVLDLSRGGAAVAAHQQLPPGSILTLHIRSLRPGGGGYLHWAKVVYQGPLLAEGWLHGVAFIVPLTSEQLDYLVGT
jgi:hypothetical protein